MTSADQLIEVFNEAKARQPGGACVTSVIAALATVAALLIGTQISRASTEGDANSSNETSKTALVAPKPLRPVSGVVLADDTGLPLSNALVRVAAPSRDLRYVFRGSSDIYEARTNQEGRFTIQVPQAETLSLDVLASGYESASGTVMAGSRLRLNELPFPADSQHEFSIKLRRALYVTGVVVDEANHPLSNVDLEATFDGANFLAYIKHGKSDAAGRFEIFDFPLKPRDNAKGRLRFQHPTMSRSTIEDVYALDENARKSLRVTMHRGHDIKGMVTSAAGQPVVKTLIEALPSQPDAQFKQQLTDTEGRFVLQGLPDGEIVVRVHSLELAQKSKVTVRMAGADIDVNLRLEPVVLKNPVSRVNLMGMTVTDITPELKAAYDLDGEAKGVLILSPGENIQRLGIGSPEEGEYFWVVGNKRITNLKEMVVELLRINELYPPTNGRIGEGHHGRVRIVYSNRHRSNTQYLNLTNDDAEGLKKLLPTLVAGTSFVSLTAGAMADSPEPSRDELKKEVAGLRELLRWQGEYRTQDGCFFRIEGDRWESKTSGGERFAGRIKILEVRDQLTEADLSVEEGGTKGETARAIFRVDGETLHYCGTYGLERPREFKNGVGGDPVHYAWQRIKR